MDMLVEAPQTHRDAKKNVSALAMFSFRNSPTPLPFLRPWFEMAFVVLSRETMNALWWKVIRN